MDNDPLTRDDQAHLADILAAVGPEGAYAIAEYLGIDLDEGTDAPSQTKSRPRSTRTVGRERCSQSRAWPHLDEMWLGRRCQAGSAG